MEIPEEIQSALIPSPKSSLLEFIRWKLPPISSPKPQFARDFFSGREPVEVSFLLQSCLQRLVIPDQATIRCIAAIAPNMIATGSKSIVYAHLSGEDTAYPLWVVFLWEKVAHFHEEQKPWLEAEKWLQNRPRTPQEKELLQSVHCLMDTVPYEHKISGIGTFQRPIRALWRLLGDHWIDGEDIDILLNLLLVKLERMEQGNFVVAPVYLTDRLMKIASTGFDEYGGKHCRWLKELGNKVFNDGTILVTVLHLGSTLGMNHWAPLAVDGSSKMLLFGDSLARSPFMPDQISKAYTAWHNRHCPESFIDGTLRIASLSVTVQTDGHSCGPLSINALGNFALQTSLADQANPGMLRVELFQDLLLETLCNIRANNPMFKTNDHHAHGEAPKTPPRPSKRRRVGQSSKSSSVEFHLDEGSDNSSDCDPVDLDTDEEEYDDDEDEGVISGVNGVPGIDAASDFLDVANKFENNKELKNINTDLAQEIIKVSIDSEDIQVNQDDDEIDGTDKLEENEQDPEKDLIEELNPGTRKAYRLKMANFDKYLRLNGAWHQEKTVFEVEVDDVPENIPQYIRTWIGSVCDPYYIAKTNDPSRKPLSFASATQMRAAVNYGFTRNPRRSPTWSYDRNLERMAGNPAQCILLARYIKGLHMRKTRDGECATSSRAASSSIMRRLHEQLLSWITHNRGDDSSHFRKRAHGDWGGRFKRFSTWLIGLIAFRCLLRSCDVVDLTVENLVTLPLHNNDTHIGIQPWKSKTQQRGNVEPFNLYAETNPDLMDFCVARGIHAWLRMTGIRTGYLFPKIYGYDQLQDSKHGHMTTKDFLANLRHALMEIGEPPALYTVHAFRRGGTQFLYEELGLNLIEILQWGKWSTNLTYSTILRYLMADTDLVKKPRSQLMLPKVTSKAGDVKR